MTVAREAAMLRAFAFFGAPVGLFFVMGRVVTAGSWLDMGTFTQNVMPLARAPGLDTCPQQAWCDQGAVVRRKLGIPDNRIFPSGMTIAYAYPAGPKNTLRTDRVAPETSSIIHR